MAGLFAKARQGTFVTVGLQLAMTVLAGLVAALLGGWYTAWSALLGGFINSIASLSMALALFAAGPGAGPQQWLGRFLIGEALKFVITVALFIFAIVILKAAFLPLILAYMATYVAYWIGMVRISSGRTV
jgi:ATP synthase protein I